MLHRLQAFTTVMRPRKMRPITPGKDGRSENWNGDYYRSQNTDYYENDGRGAKPGLHPNEGKISNLSPPGLLPANTATVLLLMQELADRILQLVLDTGRFPEMICLSISSCPLLSWKTAGCSSSIRGSVTTYGPQPQ